MPKTVLKQFDNRWVDSLRCAHGVATGIDATRIDAQFITRSLSRIRLNTVSVLFAQAFHANSQLTTDWCSSQGKAASKNGSIVASTFVFWRLVVVANYKRLKCEI